MTRDPVPTQVLKLWRPRSLLKSGSTSNIAKSDIDDTSPNNSGDDTSSIGSTPLKCRRRKASGTVKVKNELVVIDISGKQLITALKLKIYHRCVTDDEWDAPAPVPNAPTPPFVETVNDTFNSLMNFADDVNPWI